MFLSSVLVSGTSRTKVLLSNHFLYKLDYEASLSHLYFRFIGLISVLATSTLSRPESEALGQKCLLNRFPKFGKSLTFENIKVIEAKFPSKQKFDALGRFVLVLKKCFSIFSRESDSRDNVVR